MRALVLITLLAASHALSLKSTPAIATLSPKAIAGAGLLRLKGGNPGVEISGADGDGKVYINALSFENTLSNALECTVAWLK